MSGSWGRNIKYSIFGESHGKGIGVVIDGLPPGIELDLNDIQFEMNRRRPGRDKFSTPRQEMDQVEIISGVFNHKTTGAPLCGIIFNSNQKSKDYESLRYIMRPGHGDYPGYMKYGGHNDYRGGGHFSGRITAPLVFAGAIAKQILMKKGISIGCHIESIGDIWDKKFDPVKIDRGLLERLRSKEFCVMDDERGIKMKERILMAKESQDSVGGVVEGCVLDLPVGLGGPYFDGVEGVLSQILFSIPAVKGVEFGAGFDISKMTGSEANDGFYMDDGIVKTYTNNNGGILGGITNGMPIVFRVAFKPTPSIEKVQKTIHVLKKENDEIQVKGRHDPCIVPRAIPVVEAGAALGILDIFLQNNDKGGW